MQKPIKVSPVLVSLFISLTLSACAQGPEKTDAHVGAPPPQNRGPGVQNPQTRDPSQPTFPPDSQPPFPPAGQAPQAPSPNSPSHPGAPEASRTPTSDVPPVPRILTDLIASGVKVDGDLDGEREAPRFNTVIAALQANQPALRSLIQTRVLKRIWFSNSNPDSFFDVTDGTLFIATQKPGLRILGPVLQSLAQQYDISARLGIPVRVAGALDLNYLNAVSLLRASFFEIAGKTDQIRKITLGSSRSSFSRGSSGHLQIGYLDSFDELEQVLSWIH